jgi:hypothetical protein
MEVKSNKIVKPTKAVMKACTHCRKHLNIVYFGKFRNGETKKTCMECSDRYSKYEKINRKNEAEQIGERGPMKKERGECKEGEIRCIKCKCPRLIENYRIKLNGNMNKCCDVCLRV